MQSEAPFIIKHNWLLGTVWGNKPAAGDGGWRLWGAVYAKRLYPVLIWLGVVAFIGLMLSQYPQPFLNGRELLADPAALWAQIRAAPYWLYEPALNRLILIGVGIFASATMIGIIVLFSMFALHLLIWFFTLPFACFAITARGKLVVYREIPLILDKPDGLRVLEQDGRWLIIALQGTRMAQLADTPSHAAAMAWVASIQQHWRKITQADLPMLEQDEAQSMGRLIWRDKDASLLTRKGRNDAYMLFAVITALAGIAIVSIPWLDISAFPDIGKMVGGYRLLHQPSLFLLMILSGILLLMLLPLRHHFGPRIRLQGNKLLHSVYPVGPCKSVQIENAADLVVIADPSKHECTLRVADKISITDLTMTEAHWLQAWLVAQTEQAENAGKQGL